MHPDAASPTRYRSSSAGFASVQPKQFSASRSNSRTAALAAYRSSGVDVSPGSFIEESVGRPSHTKPPQWLGSDRAEKSPGARAGPRMFEVEARAPFSMASPSCRIRPRGFRSSLGQETRLGLFNHALCLDFARHGGGKITKHCGHVRGCQPQIQKGRGEELEIT
jgi:hypothetical protein